MYSARSTSTGSMNTMNTVEYKRRPLFLPMAQKKYSFCVVGIFLFNFQVLLVSRRLCACPTTAFVFLSQRANRKKNTILFFVWNGQNWGQLYMMMPNLIMVFNLLSFTNSNISLATTSLIIAKPKKNLLQTETKEILFIV